MQYWGQEITAETDVDPTGFRKRGRLLGSVLLRVIAAFGLFCAPVTLRRHLSRAITDDRELCMTFRNKSRQAT